ncbi:MAG: hypothetical protein KGZ68_12450 [Dechloromonas sp.]|nr:hypothetical protein [Dechloromonas sp.]
MSNYQRSDDLDGMMRLPSLDAPPQNTGYARGSATDAAPPGMTFVPEMNTYVDADVAAQLGLGRPPSGVPASSEANLLATHEAPEDYTRKPWTDTTFEEEEMSEEELEALQDKLAEEDPEDAEDHALSDTYAEIADRFSPADLAKGMEAMVSGDLEGTLDRVAEATGFDRATAANIIETTVLEAAPHADAQIGSDRWASLVYAATSTPDDIARRIVADFVTGKLPASNLGKAYALWYDTLPDTE